jgi:hypothetical protein
MVLFPAPKGSGVDGSYSYPCISPWREQQYDQCDQVEEERGRAPNLSDEQEYGFPLRLDTGRDAARSKVVEFLTWLGELGSFLFPSNWLV